MKKFYLLTLTVISFISCIKEEAPNSEADILNLSFPKNSLRTRSVEINNDFIMAYPKPGVSLKDSAITHIEVTPGATYREVRTETITDEDVLFFIDVTSESKEYTKRYSIVQSEAFPESFEFETWVKPSSFYQYENPKDGSLQWYSSNNGAAIAWNNETKPANQYLARKITINGSTVAELRTMEGPGSVMGNTFIPCLAGSLYLGGFSPLTGLVAPLKSTKFGVPFNDGKPEKLKGYYMYKEGTEDFINSDGTTDKTKKDICTIYAIIFKTDENVEFLYGDNIADSPNVIARAEIQPQDFVQVSGFTYFEVDFDYDSYPTPFDWDELMNDKYKVSIVFSSSSRGQYYEGRPGSTLTVDNISLTYEAYDDN